MSNKDTPEIIRPGSPEDPYHAFARRMLEGLSHFADVLEVKNAEYWGQVAQWVADIGDEDPDRPGNLREDPQTVLEALLISQARATVIYRRGMHLEAIDLVKRIFFALEAPGLADLRGEIEDLKGALCRNKSD